MESNSLVVVRRAVRELWRAAVQVVLPSACAACGVPADGLCAVCLAHLQRRTGPACERCGERLAAFGAGCGGDHRALRNLVRHAAPFAYAGTGGALVRRFKLDADPGAGRWLARAMAGAWRPFHQGAWRRALVVPVPLHRTRRAERGFDQAEWLARAVARALGLTVAPAVLVRVRSTLPQGDPRVTSRLANVEGAFRVARARRVAAARVLLVDDVLTSGATLRACAALLRDAGAHEVAAVTACRS